MFEMSIILYFIFLFIFLLAVIYLLHIPLPHDIADRKKLQVAEVVLRLANEYLADVVEWLFGARGRNTYTRYIMAIGFLVPLKPPKDINVRNDVISGVRVRVYTPLERKSKRVLVFIHGGGWAIMKPEYYDQVLFGLIRKLGMMSISIDYRLAPEFPYPAAVDDCEKVIRGLHTRSYEHYDIDKDNIILVGDSAGGNLTAVTTQRLVSGGVTCIKTQILIYPVIHIFGFQSPSYLEFYEKFKGTALLNPRSMARWILLYLGVEPSPENVRKIIRNQHISDSLKLSAEYDKLLHPQRIPPEVTSKNAPTPLDHQPDEHLSKKLTPAGSDPSVSPIFGATKDLPPTMVITQGYDVLRDEGILYARRLQDLNVPCDWKHYERGYHGILNMPYSQLRKEMMRDLVQYIQKHL